MMTLYFCQRVSMLKTLLKRYFLTGLLVIIPIWGTILILKALFVAVDGILGISWSGWCRVIMCRGWGFWH